MEIEIPKQVLAATWCIDCFPEYEYALFTYKGNSLCEKHFKLSKEKEGK